jgi:Xaa-Pro aminopeptidase
MLHRIEAVQERVQSYQLDAFVVSSPAHIRYLFGFTGSNAIALLTSQGTIFITDRRYTDQAGQQVKAAEIVIAKSDLFSELSAWQQKLSKRKLGVEVAHINARDFFQLKKILPETHFIATERIIERICSIKEESEVANIRSAAQICARVFEEIPALLTVGKTELEISAEITYRTRMRGSEKDPFEPIVAAGERSALPHGIASDRKLVAGDLVIVDFGAMINGYAADCTRTYMIGEANSKQQQLIDAVSEALNRAEAAAGSGMTCKELDGVARSHLKDTGFGDYFQHALGHGLGLSVHELPRVAESSTDVLATGQVITMEPGVYVPDVGGVRIEDDYLILNDGVENLSPFPREVVSVG